MNVIKEKTVSICSVCFKTVPASVFERDGRVYLKKRCIQHGSSEFCIEANPEFYRSLCNQQEAQNANAFQTLSIAITYKCNLKCTVCFANPLDKPEPALDDIRKQIKLFDGSMIWLTGGEPTLCENLAEIITYVRSVGKTPVVVTNGLKLCDGKYVSRLKASGLEWVHFSFNGFSDQVYCHINGAPLYKKKMKALRQLKRKKIKVALSFMYYPGINCFMFKRLISFCLVQQSFIHQLRVRPVRPLGGTHAFSGERKIFLSDLLKHLAQVCGASMASISDCRMSRQQCDYYAAPMPCHYEIDFNKFLRQFVYKESDSFFIKIIKILFWLIRRFGFCVTCLFAVDYLFRERRTKKNCFSIKFRTWYDKDTIDLNELSYCVSAYSINNHSQKTHFCKALVLNECENYL